MAIMRMLMRVITAITKQETVSSRYFDLVFTKIIVKNHVTSNNKIYLEALAGKNFIDTDTSAFEDTKLRGSHHWKVENEN